MFSPPDGAKKKIGTQYIRANDMTASRAHSHRLFINQKNLVIRESVRTFPITWCYDKKQVRRSHEPHYQNKKQRQFKGPYFQALSLAAASTDKHGKVQPCSTWLKR